MKKTLIPVLLFLWSISGLFGQKVLIVAMITPPYTPYPLNYLEPEYQSRLSFQVTSLSSQTVTFKLTFELTSDVGVGLRFKDNFKPRKFFTLLPNQTKIFTADDLRGYFLESDLVPIGVNRADLLMGRPLPAGNYQCCFKAFDATTNELISSPTGGCSSNIFLAALDAPILTLPLSNSNVVSSFGSTILFQWIKPPQAMPDLDYEFVLKKVPTGQNPQFVGTNNAFPTAYTGTISNVTLLNYGPDKPSLEVGAQYVWRVRAVDKKKRYVFANDGWSDVFSFKATKPKPQMAAPVLLLPQNKDSTWALGSLNGVTTFSWRTMGTDFNSSLTFVVKALPKGRQADNVMNDSRDSVVFKKILRGGETKLDFSEVMPNLLFGQNYVWQVTLTDLTDSYDLLNEGRSEVFSFRNLSPLSIRLKKLDLKAPIKKEKISNGVKGYEIPLVADRNFFFEWNSAVDDTLTFGAGVKPDSLTAVAANNAIRYEISLKKQDPGLLNPDDQMNAGRHLLLAKIAVPNYSMSDLKGMKYQYSPKDTLMEDQKNYVWYVRAFVPTNEGDKQEQFSKTAGLFKLNINAGADTSKLALDKRINDAMKNEKLADFALNCDACAFKYDSLWEKMTLETLQIDSVFSLGSMRLRITKLMTAKDAFDLKSGFGSTGISAKPTPIYDKDVVTPPALDSSLYKKGATIFRGEAIAFLPWRKMPVLVLFDKVKVVTVNGKKQAIDGVAIASKEPAFSGGLKDVMGAFDLDRMNASIQRNAQLLGALLDAPKSPTDKDITPLTMPFGLSIPFSGNDTTGSVSFMFSDLRITHKAATLSAFAGVDLNEGPVNVLTFGATKCITQDSFCGGNLRLFLADEKQSIVLGGSTQLDFLGDPTGMTMNSTFLDFVLKDSSKFKIGFQRLHISARLMPNKNMIEARDTNTVAMVSTAKPVGVTINADVTGLKDWMFRVDVPRFRMRDIPTFSFEARDVILDLTKKEKFATMVFPENFFPTDTTVKTTDATTIAAAKLLTEKEWQGLYIGSLVMYVHNFGNNPDSIKPFSFGVNQVIIDSRGLTFQAEIKNFPVTIPIGASKLSLNALRVTYMRSLIPKKFYIEGGLTIPELDGEIACSVMWAKPDSINPIEWRFAVFVKDTLVYGLKLGSQGSNHYMKIAVAPNSKFEIQLYKDSISSTNPNGVRRVAFEVVLNGWINFSIPATDNTPSVDLPALTAQGLTFKYGAPKQVGLAVSGVFGIAGFNVFSGATTLKSAPKSTVATTTPTTTTTTSPATTSPPAAATDAKKNKGTLNGLGIGLDPASPPSLKQVGDDIALEVGIKVQFGTDSTTTALTGRVGINSKVSYNAKGFDIAYKSLSKIELGFDGYVQNIVRLKAQLGIYVADPVYGQGFMGKASGSIAVGTGGIGVEAELRIGRTLDRANDPGFVYFYGALNVQSSAGIPVPPTPLSVLGLGGGFYVNMKDTTSMIAGKMVTKYVPSRDKFGFKLYPTIGLTGKPETFNSTFGVEIVVNTKTGGFEKMNITADGYFLVESFPANTKPVGLVNIKAIIDKSGVVINGLVNVSKPPVEIKAPMYMHFLTTGKWKMQIGDPFNVTQRVSVKFSDAIIGTAYIALGNDFPNASLPPIPAEVQNFVGLGGLSPESINAARGTMELESSGFSGSQIKIGAQVRVSSQGQFAVFKYNLSAVGGFDMNLTRNDKKFACGSVADAGFNQWYANGQLYAYFKLLASIAIDLGFWKGDVALAAIEAGALLEGGLPNPIWVKGRVRARGEALGFQFDKDFPFEAGETGCTGSGQSVVKGVQFLESTAPANNETSLAPNVKPRIKFTIPVNTGLVQESYTKTQLYESTSLYDQSLKRKRSFALVLVSSATTYTDIAPNTVKNASAGTTLNPLYVGRITVKTDPAIEKVDDKTVDLKFNVMLPSESDCKVTLKVRIFELINDKWVNPNNNGTSKAIEQTEELKFKIKQYSIETEFNPADIIYSYPIAGAYYQPTRIDEGRIELQQDQIMLLSLLKNPNPSYKAKALTYGITELDGNGQAIPNTFRQYPVEIESARAMKMNMYKVAMGGTRVFVGGLRPNQAYSFVLQLESETGTKYKVWTGVFRTGQYATYADKFNAWQLGQTRSKATNLTQMNGSVEWEPALSENLSEAEMKYIRFEAGDPQTRYNIDPSSYARYSRLLYDFSSSRNDYMVGKMFDLYSISVREGWVNDVIFFKQYGLGKSLTFTSAQRDSRQKPTNSFRLQTASLTPLVLGNVIPPVPATTKLKFNYVGYHRIYQDFAQLTQLRIYDRALIWTIDNTPQIFKPVESLDDRFWATINDNTLNLGHEVEFFLQKKPSSAKRQHIFQANIGSEVLPVKINYRESGLEKTIEFKLPFGTVSY